MERKCELRPPKLSYHVSWWEKRAKGKRNLKLNFLPFFLLALYQAYPVNQDF